MKNEILEKFTVLITSAFGLVAALAWNEAIKGFLQQFGLEHYGPWVYAVIITILAVLITVLLGWIAERAKQVHVEEYALAPVNGLRKLVQKKKKR